MKGRLLTETFYLLFKSPWALEIIYRSFSIERSITVDKFLDREIIFRGPSFTHSGFTYSMHLVLLALSVGNHKAGLASKSIELW